MRHPPVQDNGGVDALIDRLQAGLDLGDHAARRRAVGDQPAGLGGGQARDQPLFLIQYAGHVGQQQQARRADGAGDCARRRVGVDVIRLAMLAAADRRDNRDDVGILEAFQDLRVDLLRFADEAEVEDLLDVGIGVPGRAAQAASDDQLAVFA